MKKYLTLDIGGSAIKYALIQEDLTILNKDSIPTPMDTLDNFIETIGKIYDEVKDVIEGIAISMPGIIDPRIGYNYTAGALKYIKNLNTVELLQKRCPVNITIGNDAKCAANAEVGFGSLKDIQDGAVVVFGTGIGGCLVKDHKVHVGRHFLAGEFSSMKTNYHNAIGNDDDWCKRNGIAGLLNRVQETLDTDEYYTGKQIFDMANNGHEKVIEAINQFAYEAAVQILNIHVMFDCEKIAIGGGISAQPMLIDMIKTNFDSIVDNIGFDMPRPEIVVCQFRNEANLIGALYQYIETYGK